MDQLLDRIKGTIYGQAIGDALGLGTEFMDDDDMAWKYPTGLTHYSEIYQDRHRRRWEKGDWTDDTDMMLCIANAIIKEQGVNIYTIAQNFKDWANGIPMGIGANTYKVLMFGDYVKNPLAVSRKVWELSRYHSAANGGLMRTSIVGVLPNDVEQSAADICRLTHYDPRCVGSCVIVCKLIHAHVYGLQVPTYEQIKMISRKYDERIVEFITLSQNEDIKALNLQEEGSIGYTLRTLAAGLWAYWHAETFLDGLLAVVRAGGDADTNAAVACSILGAKFGFNAIPAEYVEGLMYRDQLDEVIQGMVQVIKVLM